ncbi:MAG: hypothetical protein IJL32_01890 [Oscillospiraceae bacterium]|nr:hypothetical protein [Oscillospiraceae bacterium]
MDGSAELLRNFEVISDGSRRKSKKSRGQQIIILLPSAFFLHMAQKPPEKQAAYFAYKIDYRGFRFPEFRIRKKCEAIP